MTGAPKARRSYRDHGHAGPSSPMKKIEDNPVNLQTHRIFARRAQTERHDIGDDERLNAHWGPADNQGQANKCEDMEDRLMKIGYEEEVAEWMIDEGKEIPAAVRALRELRKLHGKGQGGTRAHVSEAHSPTRVSGMAEQMGRYLDSHLI